MKYFGAFLVSILLTAVVSCILIISYTDPYAITQNVTLVELCEQNSLRDDFQDSLDLENTYRFKCYIDKLLLSKKLNIPIPQHPKNIILPNPYAYGNIVYKLVSTCRDSTYTDYGDKQKILMFKSKRYKQLLSVRKFESTKFEVIRKDLDEMNKKTCN